jgi:thiol-disulfide isomerase/thioredoxin
LGAALPIMLIAYTTKRLTLGYYIESFRKGFGVLLLIAATLIWFDFAQYIQTFSAKYFPPIQIEDNAYVKSKLAEMQGGGSQKMVGEKAPEITGIVHWINSPPLTMDSLRGKVVMIDFWTYSCINCIRTLPYLEEWYKKYKDQGFVLIGVHTPEFEFEKDLKNVEDAALDNQYKTWRAWNNQYWPAHYLIDKEGSVSYSHFGEGAYIETENQIRKLLGLAPLNEKEPTKSSRPLSPETYLGYTRGHSYNVDIQRGIIGEYNFTGTLVLNQVGLEGPWKVDAEKITSESGYSLLSMKVLADKVYLVMSGQGNVIVEVDGKQHKTFALDGERLYTIADMKGDYGEHVVTIGIPAGASAYAFTFGD